MAYSLGKQLPFKWMGTILESGIQFLHPNTNTAHTSMVQIAKVLEWHLYSNGVTYGHFKQVNNAFYARTTPVTMTTTHQR